MKYGVSFLPDVGPEDLHPSTYFDNVLAISVAADELGLSYVKMTEHYLHQYGGYCPNPFTFLAAVAAKTRHIRLMTGCTLPNFHHPVKTASYATMVDAISHGRLEVGFARAYLPFEFDAFGIPMNGSRNRFTETVEAITGLWDSSDFSMTGESFDISNATVLPRPVQADGIPTLIAAVRTPESFVAIGRGGHGLLVTPGGLEAPVDLVASYREAFVPRRTAVPEARVVISLPLLIDDDADRAVDVADAALSDYLRVWVDAVTAWDNRSSTDYRSYSGMARFLSLMSGPELRMSGSAVVGDPQEVVDQIVELDERFGGLDAILWQLDYGNLPLGSALRTLGLFHSDVLPKLPERLRTTP
ncbi:luciferase-like monooxygenase [Nocardia nova SH22a]|uniref:Luciferase-like monooxygenase n=1 Tax=Nocardia nova SH22a TaxID=1415166 RepID=W5TFJ7_9NOCA|nr:LLM class flavin-dependent oxidoreductase [Nocardia nova]AHH17904.1 luciferase-like monooxygenase [Nocardia nova SH22a]